MVLSKGEQRIQICINHIFSPALKKKQSKGNIQNIKSLRLGESWQGGWKIQINILKTRISI